MPHKQKLKIIIVNAFSLARGIYDLYRVLSFSLLTVKVWLILSPSICTESSITFSSILSSSDFESLKDSRRKTV